MRKFLSLAIILMFSGVSFGQLTGIKSIPGSGGPNDYQSIAAAISALNQMGVGPGGVTFNVAAGYTETFQTPEAGLITATGTVGTPIIFQKSGAGSHPVVTAAVGNSTSTDGIIKIAGGDYITFDGIDLRENPANTTATTQMEWGYALVKARNTFPVDGCQYVTIKNCSISMNGSYSSSAAIYTGNHLAGSTNSINFSTLNIPAREEDRTNNCRFFGNTITNTFRAFSLNGYNDNQSIPQSFDRNNEIGIEGSGNTIDLNVANSSICYGIYANFQQNLKIAYNSVTGYNALGGFYGITPRTSTSVEIHHNTISAGSASSSVSYGIENNNGGYQGFTSEIHHNTVQNSIMTGSGGFNAIYSQTANPDVLNIYSNVVTGNTVTTGSMTLIGFGGGAGTVNNIYDNLLYNNTKTGAGTFWCISNLNYGHCNIYNNQIYANNIATSGVVTGSSTIYGIQSSMNGQLSETIYNNQVYDLNITGTTTSVSNFIYGINTDILPMVPRNWYGNTVRNLSIDAPSGSGTVIGMRTSNGTTTNIYRNQVYNLSAVNAAGVVQGISIMSGTQVNVYNNFVSDLRTPSSASVNAVIGLSIAGGTKAGIYYNTVFLNASSTEATFGTSGIFRSGTTTLTDLRNNVIMNLSAPGSSSGATAALRWSSAYNGSYYANTSNGNNFFAGTPASNRLIFTDGIYSDQTIGAYQTRVFPNDALSFTEGSPLMNTTTAPYDLHMNAAVPTLCESGGVIVSSPAIADDFDGNPRSTTPDVGAHEFGGMTIGVVNPTGFVPSVVSSRQIDLPFNLNPLGNTVVIVWNTTGYFTAPSGSLPSINGQFAGGTVLSAGTTSPVTHNNLTGGTTYYYKAFSYNGTAWSSGVQASAATTIAPPSPFNAYAISTGGIDLSWTKNALDNDVVIAVNSANTFGQPVNGTAYTAGNTLPTAGTVIYVGPLAAFNHTGLSINTKYFYKAWSVDAFNWYSSTGSTVNATTLPCEPTAALPFTENFDTYAVPGIGCGSVIDGNGDGTVWGSFVVSGSTAHSAPQVLSLPSAMAVADDWYFIRGLNLVEGQKYQLSFFYRAQYTYPSTKFEVKWGNSPTPSGMFTTPLFSITTPSSFIPYPQATCIVTAPATGTYYFGWHGTDNAAGNIYIDDISITTSSCASPLTVTASGVTATSAEIAWTGPAANVQIDYGTPGHTAGAGTVVSASVNPFTLTSLAPSTTYDVYVRQDCGLASYSFWTGPVTFTTAYLAPEVTTGAATAVAGDAATLNGTINANGVSTFAYFEYGLSTAYGSVAAATPSSVTGTSATAVSAVLSGLIGNGTTYHYRAVGYRGGIATYGDDQTFVTIAAAPLVTTLSPSSVTSTGAILNGSVNANNQTAVTGFEYGTSTAYELGTVTGVPSPVNGSNAVNISSPVSGLTAGTEYHYRAFATNAGGTTYGADMAFTAIDLPTAVTLAGTWTPNTATNGNMVLNAQVNANNSATNVTFQYGQTTAYGSTANGSPLSVTGSSPTAVTTANILLSTTNLNREIHYRVVATSAAGTVYGEDMVLITALPPAVTGAAATFPVTGLTLNATVSANNANTTLIYEYGPTTSYGSTIAFPSNPITGTSNSSRPTILTGLTPGSVYNYRAVATNAAGTTTGTNFSFTVPMTPTVNTLAATLVTGSSARLNGSVTTSTTPAVATNFRYEYGLTPAYGTTATPTPGSSTANSTFSPVGNISNLLPNTTYYYRLYAVNAGGTVYGPGMSFTTLAIAPVVTTTAAYGISPTGAILTGLVNPNNATTNVVFEYGTDLTYGQTATATQSPLNGMTAQGVDATLTGLQPNTLYHYRVAGTNSAATTNGTDMTFRTTALLANVEVMPATMVGTTTAVLHGSVNANNTETTVTIEYGPTDGYGFMANATPLTVNGSLPTPVSAAISGLTPNTAYHFRVIGKNAAGTSYSSDATFTTPESEFTFTVTPVDPLCYGGTGSVIPGTPAGGTPPYTFDPANPPLTGLVSGSYSYTVTDATGYPASSTAIIGSAPAQLILEASVISHPTCFGTQDGSVSLSVSGGTPEYTYDPLNPPITGLSGGIYTYHVTDANGCQASDEVTINPAPALVINNPSACFGQTADLTDPAVTEGSILYGATLFYWTDPNGSIPLGNPVNAVAGTYYIEARLSQTCSDIQPVTIEVIPLLPVSVHIVASGNPIYVGMEVTYNASVVNGGTDPVYEWFINGLSVGNNSPVLVYSPLDQDQVKCVVISNAVCPSGSPATSNTITMDVNVLPVSVNIQGMVLHNGEVRCFDAQNTIVVAGSSNTFLLEPGSSATLIAGQAIFFRPGTVVKEGAYMHAYISTTFCGGYIPPMPTTPTGQDEEVTVVIDRPSFRIYPNPTSANFTIEQKDILFEGEISVEVYALTGERVRTDAIIGEQRHVVGFMDQPAGIYIVKIVANGYVETLKVIKL